MSRRQELRRHAAALEARVAELQALVADLEARLGALQTATALVAEDGYVGVCPASTEMPWTGRVVCAAPRNHAGEHYAKGLVRWT